ncbi:hypothetical protein D3C78_1054390 [compost metagenome]
MQVLRTLGLGLQHTLQLLGVEVADQTVVDHRRRVHQAAQRIRAGGNALEHTAQLLHIGDVARQRLHIDALGLPGRQARLSLDTGRATTTEQHQVPGALVHQPLGSAQAETAQATRDQVGRLATELQLLQRLFAGFHQLLDRVAIGHHDLADLPRLLHVAECLDHMVGIEFAKWQRMQNALLEQRHHLPEQTPREVRTLTHQLVGVDAEVADVIAERPQANPGVLVKVAFAQFQEATKRLEHPQVAVDRLASQGVEDHVDATPTGHGQHFVGVGQGA